MKSNKKQIISILAILTMAILLSCALVACDKAGTDKTGTDIVSDYKVTIHPNNGQSDIVWDITKAIPTITKDGFHIAGYFLDAQLTISTTLESLKATGITKNIDVYVKWEEHVEATDAAVEPTCTEKGLTEGKHCSKCGKILKAQTEIDALGHDLENHDGQEATCTEKGWKEYVTCKREGCDHTTYEEIPALGHTGGTATCTEQATCSVCGEKYGNTLEHNYGTLIQQTNATCSATGIRSHYKCSSCNKLFADDEHKTEITETDLIIPVDENAHDFGKWTRNDGTETHTRVCSFNNEHSETENCHGGTATCTEQAVCEKCNAKYGKALGHDYQGGVCTRCGDVRASEGLKYSLNSDGNGYTVTGIGSCTDTEIVIPSKHNSKPVTSIGYEAFGGCTGFTSVTIPDSVTSIGEGVFSWCTGLTSITIPDSVTSIGNYAFVGCIGLTSIIVDKENTKYHSAGNCLIETATKTLILGCKTSVIPTDGSVTSIGPEAFRGCTGLTSVTIGKGVTSIGDYAFYGCSGLTSITIPDSVTSIGRFAFNDTAWYNNQPNGPVYAGKVAYEYKGTMPENTSLTLKEGTLGIGVSAFADCSGLTNITIPDSVTSIGDRAFYGCSGLTSITIPDSVTNIGYMAFIDCEALTSVTIGNSVTSIGAGAFSYCPELISIKVSKNNPKYHSEGNCLIETERKTLVLGCKTSVIPSNGSVTSIGGGSFVGCSDLANITIPNFVTSIGEGAFYGCTGLTSVTIPDSVTSIGEGAFYGCTGLTSIIVDEGNTKYHSAGNCLIETATKTLILGCKTSVIPTDGSVTSLSEGAFYNCSGLTSITIPDSVTSIGDYAFMDCTGLTSITIPDSVTSIGDSAFKGCTGLKSVTIGNGVTSISSWAFAGCKGLTSITIPDGVTSIGNDAFSGCTSLTSVTIPDSVTSIGNFAFYNCTGLTSITIPDRVTSIGEGAFEFCTGLISVTIGNGVTSIGSYAFYGCYRLVEVYNKSALSITAGSSDNGYVAYYAKNVYTNEGGSKLTTDENGYVIYTDGDQKILVAYRGTETELVLPSYITEIYQYAFYNCRDLTSATIGNSVTSIGGYAFRDCTGLTSVTIGNGVTSISSWAFAGCKGLTSITIPDGVTSIGNDAFSDCNGLTSISGSATNVSTVAKQAKPTSFAVNITSGTSIGNDAFWGCTGLTNITIPDGVTSIGEGAFAHCTSLTSIAFNGTIAQWNAIEKGLRWKYNVPSTCIVRCIDGDIKE